MNSGVVERPGRDYKVSVLDPLEPALLDSRTVRYWSQSTKECKGSQLGKAKKLLDYDCIQYAGACEYVALPLNTEEYVYFAGKVWQKFPYSKRYNKKDKPYVLTKDSENNWHCNCQWHVKMNGAMCAHILSLKWYLKIKNKERANR